VARGRRADARDYGLIIPASILLHGMTGSAGAPELLSR
jgi:hypothetical protein